jgi:hypothetical protein
MMKTFKLASILVLVAVLLSACGIGQPQATPTPDPKIAQATMAAMSQQIAATVQAQLNNFQATLAAAPTATPAATYTPYPTYTPMVTGTAGVVVYNPPTSLGTPAAGITPYTGDTLTPSPVQDYACTFVSADKLNHHASYAAGTSYSITYTIRNSGTKDWNSSEVDVVYDSGQTMQTSPSVLDLPKTVKSGDTFSITLSYKAPGASGYYINIYGLRVNGSVFCNGNWDGLVNSIDVK